MTTKRKNISPRTRFEVFKRDEFKCAYCGSAAPNVMLHVDHIKPVSKGGKNTITNLITACAGCNGGKSDVELSDKSAIQKQINQAQELQERREQLEMMAKWIEGLNTLGDDAINILEKHWFKDWPQYSWSKIGRDQAGKWLKKFSLLEISQAMDICKAQYVTDFEVKEQISFAFNKVGGVLFISKKTAEDPILKEAYYCRAILKNRIELNKPDWQILNWVKEMIGYYGADSMKDFCKRVMSWSEFRRAYEAYLAEED